MSGDEEEFRRVMEYVTERARTDGLEEGVMAALFDVLNGAAPEEDRCGVDDRGYENAMTTNEAVPQGDPRLLETEAAQRLLHSTIPARLAYVAIDGTPRIIPTWFHWTGQELVMATYLAGAAVRHPARRVTALRVHPRVAVTIDTEESPPEALLLRGPVTVTEIDGVVPEYGLAARRYLGEEAGTGMVASLDPARTRMARIALRPTWVGLIDFRTRLPSALGGVTG
jgi:hypothetical protein